MPKAGTKVVLVDDDPSMQAVLRTLLEMEGYTVRLVSGRASPDCILQGILAEPPDMLLLDVHLGPVSGIDLLRRLRAEPAPQQLRVIMTSGSAVKAQCLAAGADDFVMKPYMPDELLSKLRAGEAQ